MTLPAEPDWNDFRTILALGLAGSVAGAAQMLNLDPSTVSPRLAAAEAAFGAVLVVRETHAVRSRTRQRLWARSVIAMLATGHSGAYERLSPYSSAGRASDL